MTATEAKAALCAHLGIGVHHEWEYIVGYVEGRIIPAPAAQPRAKRAYAAPTEPGRYLVRWPGEDEGDVMELMHDCRWRFVQDEDNPSNPSEPLTFTPGCVFTRLEGDVSKVALPAGENSYADQIDNHPDKDSTWFLFEDGVILASGALSSLMRAPRKEGARYFVLARQDPPRGEVEIPDR